LVASVRRCFFVVGGSIVYRSVFVDAGLLLDSGSDLYELLILELCELLSEVFVLLDKILFFFGVLVDFVVLLFNQSGHLLYLLLELAVLRVHFDDDLLVCLLSRYLH